MPVDISGVASVSIRPSPATVAEFSKASERLPMWVLNEVDKDGRVAARLWYAKPAPEPTDYVLRARTREDIESALPDRGKRWNWFPRRNTDDPSVLGVWL